jgi:hypothetical protein
MPAETTITLHLPPPYPLQREILAHPAKRKVICAGRRAGKTTLAALVAVCKMLERRRVLLASTSQAQADVFWRYSKKWCAEAIAAGVITKNESNRTLELAGGAGRVRVKTARNADELRGDFADFLVLDECAMLEPAAWYEVGAPMLLDTDGDAWFISTPKRRNWFFELFHRGQQEGERWHSWNFASTENPHLSAAALAEITSDMTEEAYRQEILAEFLEGEGAVFRNLDVVLTEAPSRPEEHRGHLVVAGLDFGQVEDYTELSTFCVTCMREVAVDRWRRLLWADMRARVASVARAWGAREILAEWNSVGGPNIEEFAREGVAVTSFKTTPVSKPQLIQSLALCFERAEARWLAEATGKWQLMAYEAKVSAQTGRVSYSAPEGVHDDNVIARALAWRAALTGGPTLSSEVAEMLAGAGL